MDPNQNGIVGLGGGYAAGVPGAPQQPGMQPGMPPMGAPQQLQATAQQSNDPARLAAIVQQLQSPTRAPAVSAPRGPVQGMMGAANAIGQAYDGSNAQKMQQMQQPGFWSPTVTPRSEAE